MTLVTKPFISGDRPFPFIFCSRNFMLQKYGATIDWANTGGVATVNSSFPVGNIIDGNRASFAQLEKVGREQGGNYIDLKIDLSASDFSVPEQIDMLMLNQDPEFGNVKFQIFSFTDSAYSANVLFHEYSQSFYVTIGGRKFYSYGVHPRIETDILINGGLSYDPDLEWPEGFEGRSGFIFLRDPIKASDGRFWIKIRILSPSHNLVGWDGTFDDGLWILPQDEILETTDPANTGEGTNDNHIKIFTDTGTGGHQQDQFTKRIPWRPRNVKDTYMLNYWNKMIGFDFKNFNGYELEIAYLDANGDQIQSSELFRDSGSGFTSWAPTFHLINYRSTTDGKYYSGDGAFQHEVPSNAAI